MSESFFNLPLRLFSSALDFAQDFDSSQHRHEVATVLGITLLVPALRVGLHSTVFKPLATHFLVDPAYRKAGQVPLKLRRKVEKACESAWKLTVYCVLLAVGWRALRHEPWLWSTKEYWRGWPQASVPERVRGYYAAEAGFYLASAFTLLLWEERRKDFAAMIIHHVVTVALIVGSYYHQYARIGSVVMLLHDPSDVFLESAKLCGYSGYDDPATGLFACLLVVWLVSRLIVLPFWVIWSAWFEAEQVLGYYPASNTPFVGLLCILVALHLYWFYMMAGIAYTKLTTGNISDSRESDDED